VPFLRVLRDKRGYETTYVVHWFRDGNRQRSKVLYAFRSPPGVRVGRAALDPLVLRELEARYPEIDFDWRALLETKQVIDSTVDPRRPRPRKKGTVTPPANAESPPAPPPQAPARPSVPAAIEGDTREAQIAFLNRWYPELRDRIPHRTQDPIRREALLALVERLNSGGWETDEQVVAGLQSASEALHRLSRVFSKRRRRPRRPRPTDGETPPPTNEPA
jgi:hypothetical protein